MSTIAQLALNSLKKNMTPMIVFGAIFGLHAADFIKLLWSTGSVNAAWTNWIVHGLPEVPGSLIILVVVFAVIVGWNIYEASQAGGYSERTDGYHPRHND